MQNQEVPLLSKNEETQMHSNHGLESSLDMISSTPARTEFLPGSNSFFSMPSKMRNGAKKDNE
jgi:hypothetical protein